MAEGRSWLAGQLSGPTFCPTPRGARCRPTQGLQPTGPLAFRYIQDMYQLVLTPEENLSLRLMLRMVIVSKMNDTILDYQNKFRQYLMEPEGQADLNEWLIKKLMTLNDTFRSLEMPLGHALLSSPTTTSIISLPQNAFEALKGIAFSKFAVDPGDPKTQDSHARVVANQPAIKGAFEAAEENARAEPELTVFPPIKVRA